MSWFRNRDIHIRKSSIQLNCCGSGRCHIVVPSFSRRKGDNILFFTLSRDKRISNKDTKTHCRLMVSKITCLISIRVNM